MATGSWNEKKNKDCSMVINIYVVHMKGHRKEQMVINESYYFINKHSYFPRGKCIHIHIYLRR